MKRDTKILIGAIVFFVCCVVFCVIMTTIFKDDSEPNKYYFNETMTYEGIELTVSKMATVEDIEANSDLKRVLLLFTLKNTRTESFNFQYSDFELRTEDKGEKYNYVTFGTTLGDAIKDVLTNDIIGETIKAGETKNFYIMFDTPYRAHEKKFVLCIDWDYSTNEEHYFLYNRDGSFVPNEADNIEDSTSVQKDALIKLRDDIYEIFKTGVYDKIDGTMDSSNIEKLMASVKRQCKNASESLNIEKNYSNGIYFPKWIVTMKGEDSKTYPLVYIEVEYSSNFDVQHKYIGRYKIE